MFKGKWVGLSWFVWVPLVLAVDQLSKWWMLTNLTPAQTMQVFPGLQFILAENRGMAFSLLDKQDGSTSWFLLAMILTVSTVMAIWLAKTSRQEKLTGWALVSILGGALGNLWDRVSQGYVVDFIDVSYGQWHWYTFNIADAFITVGAIVMIAACIFDSEQESSCQNP